MKRIIIGILLFMSITFIYSQATIADTLYYEDWLCGDFQFTHDDEFIASYQVGCVSIGDGWQAFISEHTYMIATLSFPTPNIPENYYLVSAVLKLFIEKIGNDELNQYPEFNMSYGTVYPSLHLQQVHYWSDLNLDMIDLPIINELVIPHTSINNWNNYFDITSFLEYSIENNHNHHQYRLKFLEKTDCDYLADELIIGTSTNYPAYIVCTYRSKTTNDDTESQELKQSISCYNYPNPFNPTTNISFSVNNNTRVKLDIYNAKGQKIRNLLDEIKSIGDHEVIWDGNDEEGKPCPSGFYFCKIQTDQANKIHKMMLVK